MKTIILDSSIYIASLNPKDVLNKKTRDFALKLEKELDNIKIVVPVLIILEVANILKKSPQEILTIFSGGEIVEFNLDLIGKLIPIFKLVKLKTADAVIVGCAKIYQAELISWDKKLVKEAKKLVKTFTPEDYF
jgi:predicted nucleic acid-binding protein